MMISMNRLNAIIAKEYKDALKNSTLLLTAVIPILLSYAIGTQMNELVSILFITLPINMALVMTCANVQAMMIAEEKEKHTLRVLMLSPARPMEVLLGKSFIAMMMTVIVMVASYMVAGIDRIPLTGLIAILIPSIIIYLALGTIIGLLSRTAMESSFVSMPVMLLFLMGPMYAPALNIELLTSLIVYTPTEQLAAAVGIMLEGGTVADIWKPIVIVSAWMAASLVACLALYRNKRYDG
ncbi:ABC transporter permease [Paenibacillus sp. SC116]|uniref:ABC transporter permease n=1 Tax=Paenibacillus sp. SC116 TaxID=2968986 RepID=UPI00215B01DA|nr:ABC transporter permease [Paenibacillus sp. SC116]MCR8844646.1 ABC transporter permease [Paenibacillus sp. SC116]